jgi:hypothetical protein
VRAEWLRMSGQGLLRTRELHSSTGSEQFIDSSDYPLLKTEFLWLGWVMDTFIASSMQTGLKVGQGQRSPFFTQRRVTTTACGTQPETYGS